MRLTQLLLVSAFMFSAAYSMAHEKGACSSYVESCKADASVTGAKGKKAHRKAMKTCVATAAKADAANGKACLLEQAKHDSLKNHEGPEGQEK